LHIAKKSVPKRLQKVMVQLEYSLLRKLIKSCENSRIKFHELKLVEGPKYFYYPWGSGHTLVEFVRVKRKQKKTKS
jgi:hypothetical protein